LKIKSSNPSKTLNNKNTLSGFFGWVPIKKTISSPGSFNPGLEVSNPKPFIPFSTKAFSLQRSGGAGVASIQALISKTEIYGFVKSPSAALRCNFVVAAHLEVRLVSQFLRALHLELFTKPSAR
jgi:hypothetical protein